MKKTYSKPQIHVESFAMDRPIAANCQVPKADMEALIGFNYFGVELDCTYELLENGGFDFNGDGKPDSHDTVCYHSNVQTAFLS